MRVSVCHVYTGALRGKQRVSDSLELGLLELVSDLIQVVGGSTLRSSARAASTHYHRAMSPAP